MKTVLHVTGLCIERGKTAILDNISWRVRRGEHWVILGANGSGKTSLLSAITGYLSPTAGEIEALGERYGASDWRGLRKSVGFGSSSVRPVIGNNEPAFETGINGRED